MSSSESLSTLFQTEHDRIAKVLTDLVQRAEHGHAAIQEHVASCLKAAGATVDVVTYDPSSIVVDFEIGTPSDVREAEYVVGTFGDAKSGVLFWAHSDSEPLDPKGWQHAPFAATIDKGRMHGWGIGDDLVGVAMMLAAADLHAHHGVLGSAGVAFASVPSKRRTQAIIHALDRGYGGTGTVYLHPAESGSGLGEIKAVASGLLRFTITVPGRPPETTEPGHTTFLHTAIDPVAIGAEIVLALQKLNEHRGARILFSPVHDAIGRSTNLHVGAFHAGNPEKPGKVPSRADLHASLTFPPTERLADVRTEVEATLDNFQAQHAWLSSSPLTVTWNVGIQGAMTPEDHPIFERTRDAIVAATGKTPFVNVLHAASDIRNPMLHKGIATVGIGPLVGDLTVSGGVDEWADVDDYVRAVEVVVRIARSYDSTASAS